MPRIEEPLDRGLVTQKDPSLLNPGELSGGFNFTYRSGTRAAHRSTGRVSFGTVSATAADVVGLRDVSFDSGDHYLIAHAGTVYRYATVGDSGSFTTLASAVGSGAQLEAVHYRNRFFLLNGVSSLDGDLSSNRVIYLSATAAGTPPSFRQHGMLPVSSPPTVTTGAGSFALSVTGYYEYWTTEVAKIVQDGADQILESTFNGAPVTVYVTSTGMVPTIQQPTIKNPGITTHWRVYRSPKKDSTALAAQEFPTGFLISSDISTATATFSDTLTVSNTGFVFPTTFNSGAVYGDFTNATAMGADDGNVASAAVGAVGSSFDIRKRQGCYAFNFGGFVGSIKGIEVVIEGYVSSGTAPAPVQVTIGQRDSTTGGFKLTHINKLGLDLAFSLWPSRSGLITSTSAGAPTTLTLGGPLDRWGRGDNSQLNDTNFDANLMAMVEVSKPSTTLSFDYVKIKVYYAASIDSTIVFPTVVYTFGDVTSQVGKNGPPPSSTTGDLYEDSLVVNDVSNASLIRYSYPGDPEAFPGTYFIDFETRDNDIVRLIKVVNNRLIVGLDRSLWRVNYLPSERDASFDRGKAIEPISKTYGIVNPMCACVFSPDGGMDYLAGICHRGIFVTNGYGFELVSDMLEWRNVISTSGITSTPIALVNDSEQRALIFYYRNDGNALANETYLALKLHYDEQPYRMSGPTHMRNFESGGSTYAALKSAWVSPRANGSTSVYLGYGGASTAAGAGQVWVESGTTIPANEPRMSVVGREMYPGGKGNEAEIQEVYGYSSVYTGSPQLTYALSVRKTNDSGAFAAASKSLTLSGQKLHKVNMRAIGEGFTMSLTASASAFQQEAMIFDLRDFGLEDAGRA